MITISEFSNLPILGKGIFHKLFLILFKNDDLRFFVTIITFFVSLIVVFTYFRLIFNRVIILYFLFSSFLIFPFMQEYLDPIVYLLVLTFMNEKFELSKNFTYFITAYYVFFHFGSKIYYNLIINLFRAKH